MLFNAAFFIFLWDFIVQNPVEKHFAQQGTSLFEEMMSVNIESDKIVEIPSLSRHIYKNVFPFFCISK